MSERPRCLTRPAVRRKVAPSPVRIRDRTSPSPAISRGRRPVRAGPVGRRLDVRRGRPWRAGPAPARWMSERRRPGSALRAGTVAAFGRPDIVLANAGVYLPGDLVGQRHRPTLDALIATNVTGVMRTVQRGAWRPWSPRGSRRHRGHQFGVRAIRRSTGSRSTRRPSTRVQAFVHGVRRQFVGSGVRIGAVGLAWCSTTCGACPTPRRSPAAVAAGEGIRSEDVADAVDYMSCARATCKSAIS